MYTTNDLYLASALQESGHPVRSVWKEGGRATFAFDDDELVTSAVAEYFAGRMSLEAQGFAERIRSAKSAAINAPPRRGGME